MRIAGAKAESICSIPPGKLVGTIRSGSYLPQHMAFALDHTIWTIGFEMGYESRAEDFNVIHHYTRSGKEMGSGASLVANCRRLQRVHIAAIMSWRQEAFSYE
jgi:hypothetical protein